MKNFVVGLLSNRFGIVLATLNVCYFASCPFTRVPHALTNFGKLIVLLNMPSAVGTAVLLQIADFLFSKSFTIAYGQIWFPFLFFITLQWLFIAWIARTVALKIQAIRS